VQLAHPIESNDTKAIDFSIALIRNGLLCEQPLFNIHDFIVTIALLDDASSSTDAYTK
jgi:hypothetical protein